MYQTTVLIIAILMPGIGIAQNDQGDDSIVERLSILEKDVEALTEEQSAFYRAMQDAIQFNLYGTFEYENFEQTNMDTSQPKCNERI